MNLELFGERKAPLERTLDLGAGCRCVLLEGVLEEHEALQRELVRDLPWMQEVYRNFGKTVPAPRWTSYHGTPEATYRYSGIVQRPHPFTPTLERLRAMVAAHANAPFNAVLVNHYRDGRDGMGYHADDEPELGPRRDDIAIACLSLGAPRRFRFKRRRPAHSPSSDAPDSVGITLPGGSLLTMRGQTQYHFLHALPKTKSPVGPRCSLTFRIVHGEPRRQ